MGETRTAPGAIFTVSPSSLMEPDDTPPRADDADRSDDGRSETRALDHLRERVDTAAREIERLRAENAALAQRVLELQDARDHQAPSFSFGGGDDTEALKARVQGFIDTIDGLLAGGDGADREAEAPDARARRSGGGVA